MTLEKTQNPRPDGAEDVDRRFISGATQQAAREGVSVSLIVAALRAEAGTADCDEAA